MGTVHTVAQTDAAGLARRLRPRDDALVLEVVDTGPATSGTEAPAPSGSVTFGAAEGPFRAYTRTVAWRPGDEPGAVAVQQTMDWWVWPFPYWGWVYEPLLRRTLPEGIPAGVRPWWTMPDRMSPRQSTVVATMAMFNVVAGLLFGLLTQVLTFVAVGHRQRLARPAGHRVRRGADRRGGHHGGHGPGRPGGPAAHRPVGLRPVGRAHGADRGIAQPRGGDGPAAAVAEPGHRRPAGRGHDLGGGAPGRVPRHGVRAGGHGLRDGGGRDRGLAPPGRPGPVGVAPHLRRGGG